jgi:hypothetical protein
MKTVYYYQTFCGLQNISDTDKIIVSAIHCGQGNIYLNDKLFDDKTNDSLWYQLENANKNGIEILFMLGGAGGAYKNLFDDYELYFPKLMKCILDKPFINGIDLDVEEEVDYFKLLNLIKDINAHKLKITMSPLDSSLYSNRPGMGGFIYSFLYNTPEGQMIDCFHVQAYFDFFVQTVDAIVKNGYPIEKICLGMNWDFREVQTLDDNSVGLISWNQAVRDIHNKYGNTSAGLFMWEYCKNPEWSSNVKEICDDTSSNCSFTNYIISIIFRYIGW